jgi:hypothetical protein
MAMLVDPKRPWRITTSDKHSTVWDGRETLFDFNFQAFGIPADQCFAHATDPEANPEELKPGKECKVYLAEHYSVDVARLKSQREAASRDGNQESALQETVG